VWGIGIARKLLFALAILFPLIACGAGNVVSTGDSGAGSLRNAVAGGGNVTFSLPAGSVIQLTSGPIAIPTGTAISGPGADQLAVSVIGSGSIFTVAPGVSAQVSGLTLKNGNAVTGGAIVNQGTLTLSNLTLANNTASDSGGAIYNTGTLTISGSTFNANTVTAATCAGGGAIRSEGDTSALRIVNSTITGNSAAACSGGGISFNDGTATLVSSTIDANTAGLSGGNVYKGSAAAALTVRNTILSAGNVTSSASPANPDLHGAYAGGLTSFGGNLIQTKGDAVGFGASDKLAANPQLTALGNFSGPTNTQALGATSVAIDLINPSLCVGLDGVTPLTTDQRGITRPQGSACDSGAFEVRQSAFDVYSVIGSGTVSATAAASPISGGIAGCTSSLGANCTAVYSGDPATSVTFTATPAVGYTFSGWQGDCSGTTCVLQSDAPHAVGAIFTLNTYTVTPSAGANGSITPNTAQTVNYNGTVSFTVTPNLGYTASVGGTCGGTLVGNTYTTNAITANCTVSATFTIQTFTVTPSAGANGSITPSTPQPVNYGASAMFTVTPNTGYTASVGGTCGGALVGTTYTTNAITANCTVVATFTINTYTVTPSAGANGSITPNTPQTVNYNSTATFTVTPNTGYVANVVGTCGGALVGTTYTTNPVTANCTVSVTFAVQTFTVTPSAGANGSITPNTPQTVNYNTTTTFTVTPNAGYTASVGGTCGGTLVGNTYTTSAVTANCTVAATFTIKTFTVTPSAGANGSITPNTPQTVNYNTTTTFTVTPNTGYVANVGGTCGGTLVGNTYTTNAITSNCTVSATFALQTFTVTPSAGANGSITPNTPQTVNYNTTTTFTVTPNTGYTASVGGTCGGTLVGTTYTTNAVTANCTVVATFTINTYTVTPSAGANGSITPNTPQTANYNTTLVFTMTPNIGYVANVGGTCGGTLVGNTYTTNPITANCTVAASFALSTFTVAPSAGANGTIAPNTPQTVNYNATTTFTVTPNTGYTASVGGTCGGNLVGNTYTTSAITADCTVVASFAINTYTVTATAGANGTITPPTQTIDYGSTATFTVTPDAGYSANVTGDTCTVTHGSGNTWTTNAITANCAVTATFSLSTYAVTTTVGANGTLVLADSGIDLTAVPYGSVLHFTVTPNPGYMASVSGCGGTLSGNTYTTGSITADCTVAATFASLPVPDAQSVSHPNYAPVVPAKGL